MAYYETSQWQVIWCLHLWRSCSSKAVVKCSQQSSCAGEQRILGRLSFKLSLLLKCSTGIIHIVVHCSASDNESVPPSLPLVEHIFEIASVGNQHVRLFSQVVHLCCFHVGAYSLSFLTHNDAGAACKRGPGQGENISRLQGTLVNTQDNSNS